MPLPPPPPPLPPLPMPPPSTSAASPLKTGASRFLSADEAKRLPSDAVVVALLLGSPSLEPLMADFAKAEENMPLELSGEGELVPPPRRMVCDVDADGDAAAEEPSPRAAAAAGGAGGGGGSAPPFSTRRSMQRRERPEERAWERARKEVGEGRSRRAKK